MTAPNENSIDVFAKFGEAVKALVHAQSKTKSKFASSDKNADVADAVFPKKADNAITTYFKDKLELALQTTERQLAMNLTATMNNTADEESQEKVKPT